MSPVKRRLHEFLIFLEVRKSADLSEKTCQAESERASCCGPIRKRKRRQLRRRLRFRIGQVWSGNAKRLPVRSGDESREGIDDRIPGLVGQTLRDRADATIPEADHHTAGMRRTQSRRDTISRRGVYLEEDAALIVVDAAAYARAGAVEVGAIDFATRIAGLKKGPGGAVIRRGGTCRPGLWSDCCCCWCNKGRCARQT